MRWHDGPGQHSRAVPNLILFLGAGAALPQALPLAKTPFDGGTILFVGWPPAKWSLPQTQDCRDAGGANDGAVLDSVSPLEERRTGYVYAGANQHARG
jgi:hypothetical protein